ncbi:flagellar biosynthetic protein FliR [Cucumibacter marinus]|uniref:flagellar biosynthetic protein FliR n=1 Tax=Cucumibacter marinus TaxID=1121252 RepID=UPI000414E06E|nr:flagellar biosynthetic protein FliR [Cucumibacter marinus]
MTVEWLPQTALVLILIFARLGTLVMLMPGFSANGIPTRIRLAFALAVTFVMYPLISQYFPDVPETVFGALVLLGHELAVGLMIGGVARLLTSAAQVAGSTIAFQSGLAFAQTADPTQGGVQGAVFGNFIAVTGIAMVFALDLHHLVLAAIYHSYELFTPQSELMVGDATQMAIKVVAASFTVGLQMAAPFVVFGLVFYFGLGVLARLMPQIQVFFIAMPANIMLGLVLFAVLIVMIMNFYMAHIEQFLSALAGQGA